MEKAELSCGSGELLQTLGWLIMCIQYRMHHVLCLLCPGVPLQGVELPLAPCPCCCSCRLAHANLGFGLASAAGLLALADKASLATAFLSFSCGLSGELLVSHAQHSLCQPAKTAWLHVAWARGCQPCLRCVGMHLMCRAVCKAHLFLPCRCSSCGQALKHADSQDGTKSE
jgi:hypothetical protein